MFFRSLGPKEYPGDWQCLQCEHLFSSTTLEPAPIDCPKCPGQAVRLARKTCPDCGKRVVVSRVRLTEQGRAGHEKILAQKEARTLTGPYSLAILGLAREAQYRIKDSNGKYIWTEEWYPWTVSGPTGGPEGLQTECDKCGARLDAHRR